MMEGYAERRIELEAKLKEEIGDYTHNMDVHLYNIFSRECSFELSYCGRKVCSLNYDYEKEDINIISFVNCNSLWVTQIHNFEHDSGVRAKQLFLLSEVMLMSDKILTKTRRFISSMEYVGFTKWVKAQDKQAK